MVKALEMYVTVAAPAATSKVSYFANRKVATFGQLTLLLDYLIDQF
jgi:hypothetical protein